MSFFPPSQQEGLYTPKKKSCERAKPGTMCFDCKHQLLTDQNKNFAPSIYFIIKKRRISIRIIYLQTLVLSALWYISPSAASTAIHHPLSTLASIFRLYGCVHSPASYTLPLYLSRSLPPASHKKSCINEKKRKEKTERCDSFFVFEQGLSSLLIHMVPPFGCYVGKKLAVSSFPPFSLLLPLRFSILSMAFEMISPKAAHRANIFFLVTRPHSTPERPPPGTRFRSIFRSNVPLWVLFAEKEERSPSLTHDIFRLMPAMPSFYAHVRLSTGIVMWMSRCFDDKQHEPMPRSVTKMIPTHTSPPLSDIK